MSSVNDKKKQQIGELELFSASARASGQTSNPEILLKFKKNNDFDLSLKTQNCLASSK